MLGADTTTLSDLDYTIDNIKSNVDCNRIFINKNVNINVEMLDWFDESTYSFNNCSNNWDVIVAAGILYFFIIYVYIFVIYYIYVYMIDVVWLDHLVPPLVRALSLLATTNTTVLLSHQKRAQSTHNLLFSLLKQHFHVIEIPESEYHPSFISPKIKLYKCNKILDI
jgi:hypothetical protein